MPDIAALLTPNPFAGDDGSLPRALKLAFEQPTAHRVEAIVSVLDRVLVPVIPHAHPGRDEHGKINDHQTAALDLQDEKTMLECQVIADNRKAVAVFSAVDALLSWNPEARPVPAGIESVALATLKHHGGQLVLDPGSDSETWIGRSAVISLATGGKWLAPWADDKISQKLAELGQHVAGADAIEIIPGMNGRSVIEIYLPAHTAVERVMVAAQEVGRALELDPYLKARLDFVEIRPRQA
ncbi:SseB family protein [Arcanobacterium phocisimile]|uniref:SseB family protein n=1 Tax=Arcanobacterium phocisimile TaxID=1302235 RepID=A0ABX7IES9_9ACTO|nr:SseB family protein [Arcanobacterium phocisimile]QRV01471.1 SseB family protein [Arcanobacterium phocisimile]